MSSELNMLQCEKALSQMIEQDGLQSVLKNLKQIVLTKAEREISDDGLGLQPSSLEIIADCLCACEIEADKL